MAFECEDLPTHRNFNAYVSWKAFPRYRIRFFASNLLGMGYTSDRYYHDASGTSYFWSIRHGSRFFGANLEIKL